MDTSFDSSIPAAVRANLVAGLVDQVSDPRVRLALVYCQDQLQEPSLGLAQIQEALAVFRPNGRPPCCRTVQRWVEERGLPCSTDGTNNRRIYFLSQVLAWWKENFRTKSIGEDAMDRARERLLKGSYRPGSAREPARLCRVN